MDDELVCERRSYREIVGHEILLRWEIANARVRCAFDDHRAAIGILATDAFAFRATTLVRVIEFEFPAHDFFKCKRSLDQCVFQ